ncbi:hypothetical protein O3M35_000616 [Rhynocoris fuscipes]|uniref:Chemosensory protein n=1 Tax=Rhynocoris fuscipes TaxID=488301 RepID=A0AAW1DQ63_9HEMI
MFADYIDYETILSKDYLLKPYIDCIMDKGKCTEDGKYLKKALPFIVKTECKYCTDKQKRKVAHLIEKFQQYQPEQLELLKKKYDPDKYHWNAFKKLIEDYKKPASN